MPKDPVNSDIYHAHFYQIYSVNCFVPSTPWFSASEHLLELFLAMGIPFSAWSCLNKFYPPFKKEYRVSVFQEVDANHTNSLTLFPFDFVREVSPSFMAMNLVLP